MLLTLSTAAPTARVLQPTPDRRLMRTTSRRTTDIPSGCGPTRRMPIHDGTESVRGALTALGLVVKLPDVPHLEESLFSWFPSALSPCSALANLRLSNRKRTVRSISAYF